MEFVLKIWLYLAFGIAGGMAVYLWQRWDEIPYQKRLFGLLVVLLPFHLFEARIFPGGFHWIYAFAFPGGIVQTQLTALFCNLPIMVVLPFAFWKLGDRPWATVFVALFCFGEFAHHTREAVIGYQMFSAQGLALPYGPGWVTSILMGVIFVAAVVWLVRSRSFSARAILGGATATVLFAACLVAAPVFAFNDSAHHFPDNGFYEQFGVQDVGTPES
jgi:hypothetical protein